ncbi:hypothetical protein Y1Q_0007872 [Alligator mississippiensis]|uniref:Uncharacterized protein n=1 Tax=Alligator mississippiensis TaxID=8496 RepID=A0A151NEU1_ALLMI|nr:hypothetical protein Y1Q_0007872 [Alligator mississippiensis]
MGLLGDQGINQVQDVQAESRYKPAVIGQAPRQAGRKRPSKPDLRTEGSVWSRTPQEKERGSVRENKALGNL